MAALCVSQAKPITDGVTANGLLLYLPPASLHSSNKYPRDNERKNRDKLLKKEKRKTATSHSTNSNKKESRTRVCGQRRMQVRIVTKKKKKITKIRNRLLLQERVKRLRRGWGRGDGGGGGWVGGDRELEREGGRTGREGEREPNAYLLTSDVCSCY